MTEHTITLSSQALSAGYHGAPVVSEVSLTVRSGEILALIGPNGAGKSTLLKAIAGQLSPLAGTVYLSGRDMADMTGAEISRQRSLLLTGRPAAELMTCREVVAAGRYPYTGRLGILSESDWDTVDKIMVSMDVASLAERLFDDVSDGQRQRVLLARAICQEPRVLILDEPASYLDIRYQLELVGTLRRLAVETDLAVIISLHELELARQSADRVLCLKDGRVDRTGTTAEVFSGNYLDELYDLPAGSLASLTGSSERFDHYVQSGGRRLRCGYTTGTCAALAASGAARRLLTGFWPETVSLITPKGWKVEVPLALRETDARSARCGVRKDAGDDVDCTAGALILAEVRCSDTPGIRIDGGQGVGRVTKPGLDQPVGAAAINSVPRRMILEAVESVCRASDYTGGLDVVISVPEGEALAAKTFNPELGVVGGISILGTSGIVEPMSRQAMMDTIALELRQKYAQGVRQVILTPGNYGMEYLREHGIDALGIPVVKCSNYLGSALDEISALGYESVLLVGHIGKLVKVAGGVMDLHSRQADCRLELLCAHSAICGGSPALCRELMGCATTDACLDLLRENDLLEPVMDSLTSAIRRQLQRRVPENCRIGALIFSKVHGDLGRTPEAKQLIEAWNAGKE